MAITSVGYDGSITEPQWAALARYLGADYAVAGPADWKVEVVAGQDRTVRILAGSGYGHGVLDTSAADETLQLPLVSSGSRWDLACARRDWQPPGGATTFGYVQGSAAQQIPAGRLADPGVQDDQPLALVQVTAGQQLPTGLIDLRTWPSKEITAASLLAAGNAARGTIVNIAGRRWRRELDAQGNLAWADDVLRGDITPLDGWAAQNSTGDRPRYEISPDGLVSLFGLIKRTAGTFDADSLQAFDITAALPTEIRPSHLAYQPAIAQNAFVEVYFNPANNRLYARPRETVRVTAGVWWISLNGITWRV